MGEIDDCFGEVVGKLESVVFVEAHIAVSFDLDAADWTTIARAVNLGVVAAVEVDLAPLRSVDGGTRDAGMTALFELSTQAFRASQKLGKGHVGGLLVVECSDAGGLDILLVIQVGVVVAQVIAGQQIAQFDALKWVSVAVEIEVQCVMVSFGGQGFGLVDKVMEFMPYRFSQGIAFGALVEVAIAVQFGASQQEIDDMNTATCLVVECVGEFLTQLQGIGILDGGSASVVDGLWLIVTAVGYGDDDGDVPGDIFDVTGVTQIGCPDFV